MRATFVALTLMVVLAPATAVIAGDEDPQTFVGDPGFTPGGLRTGKLTTGNLRSKTFGRRAYG
jgi:hypothetical protein